jgi:hypothetical protein
VNRRDALKWMGAALTISLLRSPLEKTEVSAAPADRIRTKEGVIVNSSDSNLRFAAAERLTPYATGKFR